jgi:hypothetical protein
MIRSVEGESHMAKKPVQTHSQKLQKVAASRTPVQKLLLRLTAGQQAVRLKTASESILAAQMLAFEIETEVARIPGFRPGSFSVSILYVDAATLSSVHEFTPEHTKGGHNAFTEAFLKVPAIFLGLRFRIYDFDSCEWRVGTKFFIPCKQAEEWTQNYWVDVDPPVDVPPLPANY